MTRTLIAAAVAMMPLTAMAGATDSHNLAYMGTASNDASGFSTKTLVNRPSPCTQLERSAGIDAAECGTLDLHEVSRRALKQGDDD